MERWTAFPMRSLSVNVAAAKGSPSHLLRTTEAPRRVRDGGACSGTHFGPPSSHLHAKHLIVPLAGSFDRRSSGQLCRLWTTFVVDPAARGHCRGRQRTAGIPVAVRKGGRGSAPVLRGRRSRDGPAARARRAGVQAILND